MATYSVSGRGHRALALLATGPATLEEIRDHSGAVGYDRRAIYHVVTAMLDDCLVTSRGGFYTITERGEEALAELRLGQDWGGEEPVPNCRVFVQPSVSA